MNIALEQTEEYVNGQLKNKYGDAFIRGNNGKPCGYRVLAVLGLWLHPSYSSFPSSCNGAQKVDVKH